jgi:hypothetical protein
MSSGKRRWEVQDKDRDRDSRDSRSDDRRRDDRRDDQRYDDRRDDHSRHRSSSSRHHDSSIRRHGRSHSSHDRNRSRGRSHSRSHSRSRSHPRDVSRRTLPIASTAMPPTAAAAAAAALTTAAAAAPADPRFKKKLKPPKVAKEPVALPTGWGKSLGSKLAAKPADAGAASLVSEPPLPTEHGSGSGEHSSDGSPRADPCTASSYLSSSSSSSSPLTAVAAAAAAVALPPGPLSPGPPGPPPYGPRDATQVALDRLVRRQVADVMARKIVARVRRAGEVVVGGSESA